MRAIFIDPSTSEIKEVEYSGNFEDIYTILGVSTFEVQQIDEKNDIYCDEEGLLKPISYGFQYGDNQPLVGKGLIIGQGDEGESVGATISLNDVKKNIIMFNDKNWRARILVKEMADRGYFGSKPVK